MATPIVCPHCMQRGVTVWRARWSAPSLPAVCCHCKGLSHVLSGSGIGLLTFLMVFLSLMAMLIGHSLLGPLSGMALAWAYNLWAWRRVEMFPTFGNRVEVSQRMNLAVGFVTLLMELLS